MCHDIIPVLEGKSFVRGKLIWLMVSYLSWEECYGLSDIGQDSAVFRIVGVPESILTLQGIIDGDIYVKILKLILIRKKEIIIEWRYFIAPYYYMQTKQAKKGSQ